MAPPWNAPEEQMLELLSTWFELYSFYFNKLVVCLFTVDHLMYVLDWMRPPAPACDPAYTLRYASF